VIINLLFVVLETSCNYLTTSGSLKQVDCQAKPNIGPIMSPNVQNNDVEEHVEHAPAATEGVRRRPTNTMSDFFDMHDLDQSTQKLFREYDKDGDGSFSKAEVMSIISDLKKEFQTNQALATSNMLLKRMLFGAVVFFLLLVASIFGLSFAVASLTRETTVDSASGALYNKDGSMVVATDSRADLYFVESYDFGDCISNSAVEAIKMQVVEGKNVMVEFNTQDGAGHRLELLSPSGATFDDETGKACFPMPERPSAYICMIPEGGACNDPENRRRLGPDCSKNSNAPQCRDNTDDNTSLCCYDESTCTEILILPDADEPTSCPSGYACPNAPSSYTYQCPCTSC